MIFFYFNVISKKQNKDNQKMNEQYTNLLEEYGYDIHPKTKFIVEKNNIYFQSNDGDTIHLRVNL